MDALGSVLVCKNRDNSQWFRSLVRCTFPRGLWKLSVTVKAAVNVLHSICQQIWETQQWLQDWKRSVFIPIPKTGNAKECSDFRTIALISCASKAHECVLSHVWLVVITWTVAHQAPPSMESSGQEYWGGLLFPSPGVLDPVTEPTSLTSPALASRFFANCATWEALKPPCAYPHLFWLPLSDHPHPQLLQVWTLSHHVYVRWSCPDRANWFSGQPEH